MFKKDSYLKEIQFKNGEIHIGLFDNKTNCLIQYIKNSLVKKVEGIIQFKKSREEMIKNPYLRRNKTLIKIGFSSYKEYLNSDLWKSIRIKVLKLSNFKCKSCKNKANQVHHLSYHKDVLLGLKLESLVSLCEKCHSFIEFGPSGNKLHIKTVNNKLSDIS